jgi:hypothetical protein
MSNKSAKYNKTPKIDMEMIRKYYNSNLERTYIRPRKYEDIPLQCFIYWQDAKLPKAMTENIVKLIKDHPSIRFHIFHKEQCKPFIEKHFPKEVAIVYDELIPDSYKRDLWMYCVLYINGGIYLHPKYECVNNFRLHAICNNEYVVLERPDYWEKNTIGLHTGLLIVNAKNEFIHRCIYAIVENVTHSYYGFNMHSPTGSGTLGKSYFTHAKSSYGTIQLFRHREHNHIYLQKHCILKEYNEYQNELNDLGRVPKQLLWRKSRIYHRDLNTEIIAPPDMIIYTKIQQGTVGNNTNVRLLCVYHIGNYDVFEKMKKYIDVVLEGNGVEYDLDFQINVVKEIDNENLRAILNYLPNATIYHSFNHGFDIASFIYILNEAKQNNWDYDYVLKIHTKSCDTTRDNILHPLLSTTEALTNALSKFKTSNIGMVVSKCSYCNDLERNADINIHYIKQLLKQYFNCDKYYTVPFAAGTMFLMKYSLLRDTFYPFDLSVIYNSFHNKNTFDYHWYYVTNFPIVKHLPLSYQSLYTHYFQEGRIKGFSRNILHALENPYDTSVIMRDGMLEHAYERFFAYIVYYFGYQLETVDLPLKNVHTIDNLHLFH